MNNEFILNGVYHLNPRFSTKQFSDLISMCLCKAEALALTGATIDFGNYHADIASNFLWAISDLITEAKWLQTKLQEQN